MVILRNGIVERDTHDKINNIGSNIGNLGLDPMRFDEFKLVRKKSDVFYMAINSNKNRIMVVVYHGFSSTSHLQSIARDEETITKSIRVGDLMG